MTKVSHYTLSATGKELGRAIKDFRFTGRRTAGMEMERFILNNDGSLPDAASNDALYLRLRKKLGGQTSVEPGAHMIEIKTGVHRNAADLGQELLDHLGVLKDEAASLGMHVVPASDLPRFSTKDLAQNLVGRIDPVTGNVRRTHEGVKAFSRHGWEENREWATATTSIQFTHSVSDADNLLRWARVHAALMPLYFSVFENRERDGQGRHTGIVFRRALRERGLVPDYLFEARNGNDFIDRYIAAVQEAPMPMIQGPDGQDTILNKPASFNELPEDLKTLGNFLQATSFSWHVYKIKSVIDESALGRREVRLLRLLLEVRDFDVSDRAVPAIAGWLGALTESEEALAETEARLEALGIPVVSDPSLASRRIDAALQAVEDSPRYLAGPFGAGSLRDALTQLVLPMLHTAKAAPEAITLWEEAAVAAVPIFRSAARQPVKEKAPALLPAVL